MENPYYEHKELMNELNITTKQLPAEIKEHVVKFNQKSRFASKPEMINDLQSYSEIIAEEISEWNLTRDELDSSFENDKANTPETSDIVNDIEEPDVDESWEEERILTMEEHRAKEAELELPVEPVEEHQEVVPEVKTETTEITETATAPTPLGDNVKEKEESSGWGINLNW